ncbi:MAG: bifunctional transcriptional activator/DNA repair enzyme AdaA [Rhodothermaceae bacterium]
MTKHLPSKTEMYKALIERNSAYEGIFYAAIKTTGVFCRPTCFARKPKEENIEYFSTIKEALDNGYRPCKKCTPLLKKGETPDWIKEIIEMVNSGKTQKLKDYELKNMGIDPVKLRRWFKQNYGITFQSYLRSLRINDAFGRIKLGDKVTSLAFESGYNSVSGFTDQFKKTTGFSPSDSKSKYVVNVIRIATPLGPMLAGATEQGVCLLEFTDRKMLETQIKRLKKYFNSEFLTAENKYIKQLDVELKEYFAGKRIKFDVPLVFPGTEFQMKVWKELLNVPFGKTRSYKEQAVALKNENGIRAVAKANGDNRISILIPCHRIIGSDGSLTGYGGGVERKKWLLEHERKVISS